MIYRQKRHIDIFKTPIRAEGTIFFGSISTFMHNINAIDLEGLLGRRLVLVGLLLSKDFEDV